MEYEFRVLRPGMRPALILKASHQSDAAAARAAIQAAHGRAVQVWRDDQCVYHAPDTATAIGAIHPPAA